MTITTQSLLARNAAMRLMRAAEFKAFAPEDFDMFAGVESDSPFIAQVDEFVLVLDGANLLICHPETFDDGGFQIELTQADLDPIIRAATAQ